MTTHRPNETRQFDQTGEALFKALEAMKEGYGLAGGKNLAPYDLISSRVCEFLGVPHRSSSVERRSRLHAIVKEGLSSLDEHHAELARIALNLGQPPSELIWTDRAELTARQQGHSSKTVMRHVKAALRRLTDAVIEQRAVALRHIPVRFPELSMSGKQAIFPAGFEDYPACILNDGLDRVHIIIGSSEREHRNDGELFRAESISFDIFGNLRQLRRQVVSSTVRSLVRAHDLIAFLAKSAALSHTGDSTREATELCLLDLAVVEEHLSDHLIIVGGPDTNVFHAIASLAVEERFGTYLPIQFSGSQNAYFTCDLLLSDLSGARYARLEESGGMHAGYVLMCANPWNPSRFLVFASGIRATGTQAALLSPDPPVRWG